MNKKPLKNQDEKMIRTICLPSSQLVQIVTHIMIHDDFINKGALPTLTSSKNSLLTDDFINQSAPSSI